MAAEDFFTDPTVTQLIQKNIERVSKLEESAQKRLLKSFRRVRRQLQDRLLTIPDGTFTEQQLNVTLVQIDAAIKAINQDLKDGMVRESEILADQGIKDLITEVNRFSREFEGSVQPLNINAALIATNAQNFLINKHQASLDAYSAALRSQITSNISQSMIARDTSHRTVAQLTNNVGQFFIGEEWKLNRIVRTELHNIYNFSKLSAMTSAKEEIPDLKKSLMHPMDDRTGDDSKVLAERNPIVDMGEPFRFKFKGDTRVFMFPPDRPNDRSILVPFRKAWGKKDSSFKVTG